MEEKSSQKQGKMDEKKYRKNLEKIQSKLKRFSPPEIKHESKQAPGRKG